MLKAWGVLTALSLWLLGIPFVGRLPSGTALGGFHYALEWPRLNEAGADELREFLNTHSDVRLIVIDTLAKIRKLAKGQNVYREDYEALEKLIPLAAEYGVAVLVVHHLRKLSAADPLDEISGSTGLSGGVDGFLILKRDRGRHDATLHVDGRDVEEPAELALTWDAELASWTLAGDAEEYRMSRERVEIVEVLRASWPKSMSPKEVATALGKDPNNVGQRLYQMRQAGQVISPDRGLYTIDKDDKDRKDDKNDKNDKNCTSFSGQGGDKNRDKGESRVDKGDSHDPIDIIDLIGGEQNGSKPRGLAVEAVAEELRRSGSGPALALANYLDNPNRQRLEYLTRAILNARGLGHAAWEGVAGVVEAAAQDPRNHPLDCQCAECAL